MSAATQAIFTSEVNGYSQLLLQTTTKKGRCSSTYHALVEDEPGARAIETTHSRAHRYKRARRSDQRCCAFVFSSSRLAFTVLQRPKAGPEPKIMRLRRNVDLPFRFLSLFLRTSRVSAPTQCEP